MSEVEIVVDGLNNLDIMELESALADAGLGELPVSIVKQARTPGKYHDPALAAALIKIAVDNAPVVLSGLTSAIAVWLAKGKKGDRAKSMTIEFSKDGFKFARFEADKFQESDAAAALAKLKLGPQAPAKS